MILKVIYEFPPIPARNFDYRAIDESTYDCGEIDGETMRPTNPNIEGWGATEHEAVMDLLRKRLDAHESCFDLVEA